MKPNLDYLIQYSVTDVLVPKKGHRWAIVFSNHAQVINLDRQTPDAPSVKGLTLLNVVYSASETRLHFGQMTLNGEIANETWVSLDPVKHHIVDPRFPRSDVDVIPAEPVVPGSRTQEGPEPDAA